MALCSLSCSSSMLSCCCMPSSLDAMLMYAGIVMLIFPFGPVISTTDSGSCRLMFRPWRFGAAFMTVKVTSGGSESGARPILDGHGEVVEKWEVCAGVGRAKAGTRKVGRGVSGWLAVLKTERRARDEPLRHVDAAIVAFV